MNAVETRSATHASINWRGIGGWPALSPRDAGSLNETGVPRPSSAWAGRKDLISRVSRPIIGHVLEGAPKHSSLTRAARKKVLKSSTKADNDSISRI
jgi:hypothetical protein